MKKSQGEIFGVALLFVVLIVGIIIFGQIKANMSANVNEKSQKEEKYTSMASGTLDSILKMSTSCEVERGKDTVLDLVQYCEYGSYSNTGPKITCIDETIEVDACDKTLKILNTSLNKLFNNSDSKKGIGQIPYKLVIYSPDKAGMAAKDRLLEKNLTNFGSFKSNSIIIDESNYLKMGYRKAPSGLSTISTVKRNVNFELSLYYK